MKRIVIIVILCLIDVSGFAQQGHRYPRIGAMFWWQTRPEWVAKYDLAVVAVRDFYYENGAEVSASSNMYSCSLVDTAYAIIAKTINPDMKILPCADVSQGEWYMFLGGRPENYIMHDSDDNMLRVYDEISGAYFSNYSSICPTVSGLRFNQKQPQVIAALIDTNYWDGFATDGMYANGATDGHTDIDFDRNGSDDVTDIYNNSYIINGVHDFCENMRTLWPGKIIWVNTGTFHDESWDVITGLYLEHDYGVSSWTSYYNIYHAWTDSTDQPRYCTIDGFCGRENYDQMRFMLGLALLGNGYFGANSIYNHYGQNWYDEYETDLGYPVDDGMQVPGTSGTTPYSDETRSIWVRFFTLGCVIINPMEQTIIISDDDINGLPGYDGPYYRFQGVQDPDFNNGEPFDFVELYGSAYYSDGIWKTWGDAIILLKADTTIVPDIYLDNSLQGCNPGQNAPTFVGTWYRYENYDDTAWKINVRTWGDDSQQTWPYSYAWDGGGSRTATYKPTIVIPGNYAIYEWHGINGAATNVPCTIVSSDSSDEFSINQTTNNEQWNYITTYYLNADTNNYIQITNAANDSVLADAFKLVFNDTTSSPPQDTSETPADTLESSLPSISSFLFAIADQPDSFYFSFADSQACFGYDFYDINEYIDILLTVDNDYLLYVNGNLIGTGETWEDAERWRVVISSDTICIAIQGNDAGAEAGVCGMIIDGTDTTKTDETWKVSTTLESGWTNMAFDDSEWSITTNIGELGIATPWSNYHGGTVDNLPNNSGLYWIWSSDNVIDDTVYVRKTVVR